MPTTTTTTTTTTAADGSTTTTTVTTTTSTVPAKDDAAAADDASGVPCVEFILSASHDHALVNHGLELRLTHAQHRATTGDTCLMNVFTETPPSTYPKTLEEITKEWLVSADCTSRLTSLSSSSLPLLAADQQRAPQSEALGSEVTSFTLKPCDEGQLGMTVLVLDIQYKEGGADEGEPGSTRSARPSTVCLKGAHNGDDMRAMATSWGCHSKEINAYLNQRDEIPVTIPKPLGICAQHAAAVPSPLSPLPLCPLPLPHRIRS